MITPDGEHLTPEAEDFVKSYDEAKAEEWLVDGTEAVDDATRDEKSFREIVRKKLLPMAGRVLGLAGGAYTAYEVCSALLEPGCWVFGRDDTEIDLEDSYGTLYGWYWVPWVDNEGYLNGEGGPYRYPQLAGKRDIFIAEPLGTSTPVVLRSNVPPMPAGAYTNCGAHYLGPTGFSVANTAETTQCYYKLDGVKHWFSIPRSKWWAPADDLDLLRPQTDDPGIPNSDAEIPGDPNWADEMAEELSREENDNMRQELGHLIDPEEVESPYPTRNRDSACEPSTPQGDPLPEAGRDRWNPANWNLIEGPFIESSGDSTYLRQGYTYPRPGGDWGGWGWRHIAAKHGWGPTDAAQTEQALLNPLRVELIGDPPTARRYSGPTYNLNGQVCWRRVVVRFVPPHGSSLPARGIITSYGRVYDP